VDPSLKLDDRNHVGFIAQEVEKVLPQAVSTANDARQTKSVAYSEVIPVLNEAIKQQQTQIETLQAENEELKARLDALEAKLGK
jgi:predicted RNase H-like nuclease (RuvC/YqgF family)